MAPKKGKVAAVKVDGDSKVAQELRGALSKKGLAASGGALMELSQDERKRGFGAMDYHYKKNGIEILKEDDAARRTRLARYIVDAGEGKLSGSNIQRITNSKKEEGKTGWLHESEIAVFMGAPLAAFVVKDLPSQPSEYPTARAAGLKQYFYTAKSTTTGLEESDTAELRCDTDKVTEEEHKNIKNDMLQMLSYGGVGGSSSAADPGGSSSGEVVVRARKKPKKEQDLKPEEQITPEQQVILDTKSRYEKAMSALKQLHARMTKELGTVGVVTARVKNKVGWGEAAATHLQEQTEVQHTAAKDLMEKLNKTRLKLDDVGECISTAVDQWNELSKGLEDSTDTTDVAYKKYIFTELKEFAKYR